MNVKSGMTVVETTIVVALLLLIAAISVPALRENLRKKRAAACAVNLDAIAAAARSYAADNGRPPAALSDLAPTYLGVLPVCPSGGSYALGATADEPPTCSIPGHAF